MVYIPIYPPVATPLVERGAGSACHPDANLMPHGRGLADGPAGAAGPSGPEGQRALLLVLQALPRLVVVPHELQRGEPVGVRRVRATEERGRTAQQQDALQEHAQGDSSTRGHVQRRLAGRLRHSGPSAAPCFYFLAACVICRSLLCIRCTRLVLGWVTVLGLGGYSNGI